MKTNLIPVAALALSVVLAAAGCSKPREATSAAATIELADPGPPVATVNGEEVPERLLEALGHLRNWDLAKADLRARALKELTNYVATAQAAKSVKFAPDVDLPAMAELGRLQAISSATTAAFQQSEPVDDAALRAEYDKQVARVAGTDYDFTQLVFRDEASAAKVAAELASGKPFDKVQEAHKKDALQSRKLTHVRSAQLPPALGQALAAMKPGDISKAPVQTPLGWHVVRLDAATPREPPAFEQVKEGLRRTMARRAGEERLTKLRAEAKVSLLPVAGVPATPPAVEEKKPEPKKPAG